MAYKKEVEARHRNKKVTENDRAKYLEGLANGMTRRQAAEAAAHPPVTFRAIRAKDSDFAELEAIAFEIGTDVIEAEAFRRAVEGYEQPVWGKVAPGIDGQIGVQKVFSDRLMEVILKGRRPEYREKQNIDLRNQTLTVNVEDRSAALADVARVLAEAGVDIGEIAGNGGGGARKELPRASDVLA